MSIQKCKGPIKAKGHSKEVVKRAFGKKHVQVRWTWKNGMKYQVWKFFKMALMALMALNLGFMGWILSSLSCPFLLCYKYTPLVSQIGAYTQVPHKSSTKLAKKNHSNWKLQTLIPNSPQARPRIQTSPWGFQGPNHTLLHTVSSPYQRYHHHPFW